MKKSIFCALVFFIHSSIIAQNFYDNSSTASHWVDSVFKSLSKKERIAQLMVVRLSAKNGNDIVFYDVLVKELVQKYDIGAICLFQGGPVKQASIINNFQQIAKTPLMICIDGETGLGMRMTDSVQKFPDQLTMGAVQNESIIYEVGSAIGKQCKRINIQVNYAPVVDINNNPNNPVINFRSFGEDKYHVALLGTQIMRGMQSENIMACAKHFPGHGDVAVDSHLDLPVINKTLAQLDSLELYPFKTIFKEGVGSVMIAHLSIPAIDATPNLPASLSKNNVTALLRDTLGFTGISFTDALEMKGVTKYFPQGEAAVQSLVAGNDMLCLPGNVPEAIDKILYAIKKKKLSEASLNKRVKKILLAKYNLGLYKKPVTETANLTIDLNKDVVVLRKKVAENAITLLRHDENLHLPFTKNNTTAYIAIGVNSANTICHFMKDSLGADVFYFGYNDDISTANTIISQLKNKYENVVTGIHNYAKYPAKNFNISDAAVWFANQLQQEFSSTTLVFGNPYSIKNFCSASNIVACYEDDSIFQQVACEWLTGSITAKGKLPVTVCDAFHYGDGITDFDPQKKDVLMQVSPESQGMNSNILIKIDSIAEDAISKFAIPGCVVLVAKNNHIVWYKPYGHLTYSNEEPVTKKTVYDLASCTKICATTLAIMKLYEDGKIDLNKTLGDYLSWTKGSNKENITLRDLLLHQAGLTPYIPFYKETIDTFTGIPKEGFYKAIKDSVYTIPVAANMFMRSDWKDTMYKRILQSHLSAKGIYVYSDNDFIFLAKVAEAITGKGLDEYVTENFYTPLQMNFTKFNAHDSFPINIIAPTEDEKQFRMQLLRGYVHDPGAAMFGGVSGHAGLFSNAYDLAKLFSMLLNGGQWDSVQYFNKGTIAYFTSYQTNNSRRGLGFDKPEKDNYSRKDPYPAIEASPETFGHTGFTGTCIWADPKNNLLFIFLSNRVYPDGGSNSKLSGLNVRVNMLETVYQSIIATETGDGR